MEELFEKVGFICEYRDEFTKFYEPYFNSEVELKDFFMQVFKYDEIDKTPRRVMNQIQHLVSLANDIEKIRPARDSLRIVFLQSCIESMYKLSEDNAGKYNKKDKGNFFRDMINDEGKQYILEHFKFSFVEPAYESDDNSQLLFDRKGRYSLSIEDFGWLVYQMRGMVLHEGDYWSMQFFAYDADSTWMVSIETKEDILKFQKNKEKRNLIYHFQTTLNYEKFIYYFVKGCLNFLYEYMMYKKYI